MLPAILALQCSVTWFVNHYKGTPTSLPVGRVMMECVVEALVSNTSTILPVARKKTGFRIGPFGIAVVSAIFLVVVNTKMPLPSRFRRSDSLVRTLSAFSLTLAIDPYTQQERADFDLWYVSLWSGSVTVLTLLQ